jgi:hypothetical protein
MACGREKEQEKYGKVEYLPSDVRGFNDKHRGMPMMKNITFILTCCLVFNELTGHPKDRGKNQPNSRTNSLKPREDDVD